MIQDAFDNVTRRGFLGASLSGAALLAAGAPLAAEKPTPAKKIPVALQLYSLREEKDLPKVLKAVGEMGYDGVEFAGYFGWEKKPGELRKLLDDHNLRCCGAHTDVRGDALKRSFDLHSVIGGKFLIASWMTAKDAAGWLKAAKEFSELAEKAKALGVRVGYHAHGHDFQAKFDGKTTWEIFFDNTSPDVIMQMDTGNCVEGGGDPLAMILKYPGRSASVHLKETGGKVIGEGQIPWKKILNACQTIGGTQWYVVEYEAGKAMESVRRCRENLKKMGV